MLSQCCATIRPITQIKLQFSLKTELEERRKNGDTPGTPTGIHEIDELTGGLRKGELWVIGGPTSGGKSVLSLQIAEYVSRLKPTLVVTLEMGAGEIVGRMLSCGYDFSSDKIQNPRTMLSMDWKKMRRITEDFATRPLFINDEPNLTIAQIEAKATQMNDEHNLKLIVVDYIQLITGVNKSNRAEEIAMYSRTLKQLAKKLGCAIITPSQLNDDGKLRESRAIGQDADCVFTISQDGVFVSKNRNGHKDVMMPLHLNGTYQQFTKQ